MNQSKKSMSEILSFHIVKENKYNYHILLQADTVYKQSITSQLRMHEPEWV